MFPFVLNYKDCFLFLFKLNLFLKLYKNIYTVPKAKLHEDHTRGRVPYPGRPSLALPSPADHRVDDISACISIVSFWSCRSACGRAFMPCLQAAFAVFPGFFREGPRRWTGQGVGSYGAVGVPPLGTFSPSSSMLRTSGFFFFLFVKWQLHLSTLWIYISHKWGSEPLHSMKDHVRLFCCDFFVSLACFLSFEFYLNSSQEKKGDRNLEVRPHGCLL